MDSKFQYFWDSFYYLSRVKILYPRVEVKKKKVLPGEDFDYKFDFFVADAPYSEEPFDNSKVFVDSVPFDDDEFNEDVYEPVNYFFNDKGFEVDSFVIETSLLFVIFTLIFLPFFFPLAFSFFAYFLVAYDDDYVIYDDVDKEDIEWDSLDEIEDEDDDFELIYMFPDPENDDLDNELTFTTDFSLILPLHDWI